MFIETLGSGPSLVMIHGWAMHGGVFSALVERLRDRHTLHLVDLPGHGRSRNSAVPLELDAVAAQVVTQVPPAVWLGWSLGGLFAMNVAQKFPDAVRGLVMLAASPRFVRGADWPQGIDPALFDGFARRLENDYQTTLDRFLMLEAQGSDHAREEIRLLRAIVYAYGDPPAAVLRDGLGLLQHSDLRAGLRALAMPNLWIAGRRDKLVSPASMLASSEASPTSRFERIEHAGHAPFLTHPEEVADAILAFETSLPA